MSIPLFKVFVADEVMEPLAKVLKSGYIGQGPKVDEFEKMLSDYIGTPYINTVNNGTSGLHLALHMLRPYQRVEECEILTTPLTCTATNWPILQTGMKLRWVDVDPNTGNMDLTDLRRKLTRNTRAIMVVHWGGYPVDIDELRDIQQESVRMGWSHSPIPVIEDCAHAFGATYKGRKIGSHGNYCMFSFQAIKHCTCGDGGMLICPDDESYRRAKLLRWYGLDRTCSADFRCEQNVQEWGFKYQMNDISAVIGIENFKHINTILGRHQENGRFYNQVLADMSGVRLLENKPDRESAYWIYTLRVDRRDDFIRKMKEHGIGVSRVHDRNDKHECVAEYRCALPGTNIICADMICIPCGWWVTDEDREFIVDCMRKGW